jgi:hypothetical protein
MSSVPALLQRRANVAAAVRDAALHAECELVQAYDACIDAGVMTPELEAALFSACRVLVMLRQRAARAAVGDVSG